MKDDVEHAAATPLVWGIVIALIVLLRVALAAESSRAHVLRAILILAATGEALGGSFGVFRPRWFAERNGRSYCPAYHGVSQDFGFYNLAFALLLALTALDPTAGTLVIAVGVVLYLVHGVTHVFRYFGLYYGGGTPIPTRPQSLELRDGLQLLAAATGMVLFIR
jgi:hypothetical protein